MNAGTMVFCMLLLASSKIVLPQVFVPLCHALPLRACIWQLWRENGKSNRISLKELDSRKTMTSSTLLIQMSMWAAPQRGPRGKKLITPANRKQDPEKQQQQSVYEASEFGSRFSPSQPYKARSWIDKNDLHSTSCSLQSQLQQTPSSLQRKARGHKCQHS